MKKSTNQQSAGIQSQNLSSKMTGELPADCVIGGEYLPLCMTELPFAEFMAETKRAMLDHPDFHQEIAYAALYEAMEAVWPLDQIKDLLLQVGRMRDELQRVC
ncbi:hypothetical protein [Ferrovum sp.]|uniref:hypothetical protein n=1 Tax=Ferrovum sp. TaxID=2609467 RepID=UPI002634AF33|nr:hypothetical protein [Ferrovum sp.]